MKHLFKDNFKYYKYGGLYGSSGSYIIRNISDAFQNTVVILENNNEIYNLSNELKLFLNKEEKINMFLDLESLPYEDIITDNEILSERMKTYHNVLNNQKNIILTSFASISKKIPPISEISKYFFKIDKNISYQEILNIIENFSYQRNNKINNQGEFSIRGPIIDIYSMTYESPIRVTFDGEFIKTIKLFDINSQKSTKSIDFFILSSVNEINLTDDLIRYYSKESLKIFDEEYFEDIEYEKITNKILYPSIHNILPLFYKNTSAFIDFFKDTDTVVLSSRDVLEQMNKIDENYQKYYSKFKNDKYILEPKKILVDQNQFKDSLQNHTKIELSIYKFTEDVDSINSSIKNLPSVIINNTFKDSYKSLRKFINETSYKILLCVERESLRKEVMELLNSMDKKFNTVDDYNEFLLSKKKLSITNKRIGEGFIDYKNKIAIISDKDIFGPRSISIPKTSSKKNLIDDYINDISSLNIDSPIVHDNYGVGRYKGLINMDVEGIKTELIKIEYAQQDVLYIPVTSINLLKKYAGHTGLNTPLHNLGTDHWIKIKNRAKKKVNDIAVELLEVQSKRLSSEGYQFKNNIDEYYRFSKKFPFIETEDQSTAIKEVISDMTSLKSMDRLICGDVGFGKTEIIMRAAFIAALDERQSMILAPTTILVEQHYKTFVKRFDETAISIGKLSRLQTSGEKKKTLEMIESGKLDIIIGTHALLSKKVIFKKIGLLVIDEEHKFGVADKEKIKKLKNNIDVITLTATPIPRTLNSALSQIRDLSIIETAPKNRKSIITRIIDWNNDIISDAIEREIQRGGQIYYVHNDIKTMDLEMQKLHEINKNLKIGIIHGQLNNKKIEEEMDNFLSHKYDILVCTSIIESGLDIQNVNTIIINDSNRFGLSQLHQIRGRVGRTKRQAYAYLIIQNKSLITKNAEKRLEAIDSVNSLGGGLELATHDLEIRGAGEILGEEQSGQIYEVGYAMFTEMLSKSIEFLKTGKHEKSANDIEIDVSSSCLIPQDYINDIFTRLTYYKKISSCDKLIDINFIKDEMIDIFGPIPEHLENLFHLTKLKIKINGLNIKYIKILKDNVKIEYKNKNMINLNNILSKTNNQNNLKILKNGMIQYSLDMENLKDKCEFIYKIITKVS
tara:strand:+ start:1144 stop:4542 length:3399 start_codon:yes stop_codon:yes gene_type:complete